MASNLELPKGFEIEYSPSNELPEGFELEQGLVQKGQASISAYKAPTVIERLKNAWDWTTQVPYAAFMEQKKDNEAAALRTKGMMLRKAGKDLSEEEKSRINELDNPFSAGRYNQANNYGIPEHKYIYESEANFLPRAATGIKQFYAECMKQTGIYYSMLKDLGVGAGVGAVAGGLIGGVATKTPQGAFTGVKTGASVLARTAVAKKSFELEAGFMRQELEQLNDEFINNGTQPLSDKEMDNLSMAVGTINASLEYVGLGAILKTIPNGEKILGAFGKQGIKDLAKDATFRTQLADLSGKLVVAGISEGSTEATQEYVNFVYSNLARKVKGVSPQPLSQKIDEIMQAGLVGAVCAVTMGGVGTATQVAGIKIKQGIPQKQAKEEANSMNIDERNEFINDNIDTLVEVSNEQTDEKIKTLKGEVTYNRIKDEMERQGASTEVADNSAQLVQQAYNVITNKFGEEGKDLLAKSNLQVLINSASKKQINDEKNFVDSSLKKRETQVFKPSELLTDAQTFQYKENSDEEGVTERLNGVQEFDPLYAGNIIVYETNAGDKFVVDGHQRLGLAKRLGDDNVKLEGYLFKEKDGYTPEQMRLLAAQKNIAEGSGTAIDTAKIIKEIGLNNLPKTIPPNSTMVKTPYLDKYIQELSDELKSLPENYSDTEYMDNLLSDIDILTKIKDDTLTDEEFEKANELVNELNAAQYDNEVKELREVSKYQFEDLNTYVDRTEAEGKLLPAQVKLKEKRFNQGTLGSTNPNIYYQSAYHGTPHNFDNFLTKNIGTGEGAQAHGWGLYFAGNKDVSETYRQTLSKKNKSNIQYKNKNIEDTIINNLSDDVKNILLVSKTGKAKAVRVVEANIKSAKDWINIYKKDAESEKYKKRISELENELRIAENDKKILQEIDESKINLVNKGQLFEVDIPETDEMLDEDKSFSEQPKKIQENLKILAKDYPDIENYFDDNHTGRDIYLALARSAGTKQDASMELNDVDIKGIKYNGHSDGECYVVFDDKAVNVLKKYYQSNSKNLTVKEKAFIEQVIKERKTALMNENKNAETFGTEDNSNAIAEEIKLLEDIKDGKELSDEQLEAATDLIKDLETSYYGDIANVIKKYTGIIPKDVEDIVEPEEQHRGMFRIEEDGTAIIDILENGDASTVVHELGHFYLYSLETLANGGNKRAAKELTEVNKWLGKSDAAAYTQDQLVEFHEKFAKGFEAYLLEGSAPTKGLLKVFQNFKSWLRDIYNSTKDLDIEFSEATQMLFDRVFTTDEEYEKQVLPKYQMNYARAIEIQNLTNSPSYKFKKGLTEAKEKFSLWYDKLFIPIETRLGKISPALRDKLRNHTAKLALIKGNDLKAASDFFIKTEEIRKANLEDYTKLDLALKNRDEHTVNILANKYGFKKEFQTIRDVLEDIYNEALSVGLDLGYLDNYYPRLVKPDLTEKFLEYIDALARKEQLDVVNQVIKLKDAKISMILKDLKEADPSGFWGAEDRAKFINNRVRGFGKNNILISRNASLKFERNIDELDADFNQFYETLEPALVNYIGNSRDVIEARKFFGSEIKEIGKLRARIKRKKATLEEVNERKPNAAKYKEITRLKYELSPVEIKLEQLENQEYLSDEQVQLLEGLKKKKDRLKNQIEWAEDATPFQVKITVKKRLTSEIQETAKEIKDLIGDEANVKDSIGALITQLSQKGEIYAKDERLIRDMLVARFNAQKVCEPIRMIRDLSYIATLNDVTNAITQFGDLAFSVYKYGFSDTFRGLKKPFEITKKDLGLNDMAYEFSNYSSLSKWLKKQFEIIGLTPIDGLGKNAIIQASLLNAQKKAKSNNPEFTEKLKRMYGENSEMIRKDLAEGKVTDDTIIYAFHELSDIQPISEDQVTELYQSGGGYMKLFYTLKTFGIKALDVARQDITTNIQEGLKKKNKGQVIKGLQNMIRLQMLLWLFGVPIDALKDLLSNRDFNLFETAIDNLIPCFIINRYTIKDVFDSGTGTALANFFAPSISSTASKALSGRKSAVSHIPLIGKPLYNWFLKDK